MKAKILILEDNHRDLELLVNKLKKADLTFDYLHVTKRKHYEEALNEYNPTLILSDFKLPDIDGFEAIEINQKTEDPKPLIIISGAIGEENAADVIKAGAVDFVSKDHPKRLPLSIKRILKEQEQRFKRKQTEIQALRLERRLGYVFENSLDGILFIQGNGVILAANPAASRMLGYTQADVSDLKREDVLPSSDPEVKRAISLLENKGKYRGNLNFRCKDGSTLPTEITINFEEGNTELEGGYAIFRDISKQLAHENALQKEKDLQMLLKDIGIIFNVERDTDTALQNCLELVGDFLNWPLGHICMTNHITGEIVNSDIWDCSDANKFKSFVTGYERCYQKPNECLVNQVYKQKEALCVDYQNETKVSKETQIAEKGEVQSALVFPIMAWNEPIAIMEFYSNFKKECHQNSLAHLEVIGRHIGQFIERNTSQELVQEQERKYRLMAENSRDMISRLGPEGKFVYVSPISEELFGYDPEELMGTCIMDYIHPEDLRMEVDGQFINLTRSLIDCFKEAYRFRSRNGSYKWVETLSKKIYDSETGRTKELQTATRDITDRKIIEQNVKEALNEKKILLMEIHHRVKNNLAVISGMMQLQAFQSDNEEVNQELLSSQSRIKSMAIIHELLYESNTFSRLNFKENIEKIVTHIEKSIRTDTDIELTFDLEPIELSMDKAMPCALILNELMVNIYKYAFKDREEGKILLSLHEENGQVTLSIKDDGVGLPNDFSIKDSNTLGMKLADVLSKQLHANLEYETGADGTLFIISFDKMKRGKKSGLSEFR
jgi:PAS domain S-box-containing protein